MSSLCPFPFFLLKAKLRERERDCLLHTTQTKTFQPHKSLSASFALIFFIGCLVTAYAENINPSITIKARNKNLSLPRK